MWQLYSKVESLPILKGIEVYSCCPVLRSLWIYQSDHNISPKKNVSIDFLCFCWFISYLVFAFNPVPCWLIMASFRSTIIYFANKNICIKVHLWTTKIWGNIFVHAFLNSSSLNTKKASSEWWRALYRTAETSAVGMCFIFKHDL